MKSRFPEKCEEKMSEALRITPEEVYEKVKSGRAMLVCAYDSEEKFRSMHLKGAISLGEFRSRLPSLSKDQEIVFYCA
jgi:rhodanese-related sulfurtransferase